MADRPALLPSHLPHTPAFKDLAEAKAWAKNNFGSDLKFDPSLSDEDKIANVSSIAQELLRHQEAGVPIPRSINIMHRDKMRGALGFAGPPAKGGDPAVWLNGSAPSFASEGILRHEIGHVRDWPKYSGPNGRRDLGTGEAWTALGTSVYARKNRGEFLAEVIRAAGDPRMTPPDAETMAQYEKLEGPPIPRMLPPRRIPGYKEPSIIDHMVNLLKRKE